MKKLFIKIFCVISVLAAAGYLYYVNFEPNRTQYPVRGIDVSHHQGKINWELVAKDDVQFAYIKASEGANFKDVNFMENWRAAKQAGIARGAYHFFSLCVSGQEQAKNFIQSVPLETDALFPAIDLEFVGNCDKRPRKEDFLRELKAFTQEVEKYYQHKLVFYTTGSFYRQYLSGEDYKGSPLWLRSIVLEPSEKIDWSLWQYHNCGHVEGIDGPVDLNVVAPKDIFD